MKYWKKFYQNLQNRYMFDLECFVKETNLSKSTYYNYLDLNHPTIPNKTIIDDLCKYITKLVVKKNYNIEEEKKYIKNYFWEVFKKLNKNILSNENIYEKKYIVNEKDFLKLLKRVFLFFKDIDNKLSKTKYTFHFFIRNNLI